MKKINDFETLWQDLRTILTTKPSTDLVFNQYRDVNSLVDQPDASVIRTKNLHDYLIDRINTSSVLVVGEAAGPWGCRFSGIPFTGERQLIDPLFPIHGNRSSKTDLDLGLKKDPPFISRSAEIFWEIMSPYQDLFIVWDAFPFHSHKPDDPFSVRNPTNREVAHFGVTLNPIVSFMKPKKIISVGNKAFDELILLGIMSKKVRHPSRGGQCKFIEGIKTYFQLKA